MAQQGGEAGGAAQVAARWGWEEVAGGKGRPAGSVEETRYGRHFGEWRKEVVGRWEGRREVTLIA